MGDIFSSRVSPSFGASDVTQLNILHTLGFCRSWSWPSRVQICVLQSPDETV